MRMFLRILLTAALAASAASVTMAQSAGRPRRELDVAVTYTPERSNLVSDPIFWRQGGAIDLSAELYRGLGVALNIDGSRSSNIKGTGIDLTTLTTTIGPRYAWAPRSRRYSVFGEGLFGNSHASDSVFPSVRGAQSDHDSFAIQLGGGVDLRIGHRLAIRPIQADWVRTAFPNATTDVQNSLRLGAGIVLRLRSQQ